MRAGGVPAADDHAGALAEGLLYPLWDVGRDIGHAVRGVDETLELSREDLRLIYAASVPKDAADEKKATSFSKTTPTKTKTPQKGTSFQKDTPLVGPGI